jgi:hypothetical protein
MIQFKIKLRRVLRRRHENREIFSLRFFFLKIVCIFLKKKQKRNRNLGLYIYNINIKKTM